MVLFNLPVNATNLLNIYFYCSISVQFNLFVGCSCGETKTTKKVHIFVFFRGCFSRFIANSSYQQHKKKRKRWVIKACSTKIGGVLMRLSMIYDLKIRYTLLNNVHQWTIKIRGNIKIKYRILRIIIRTTAFKNRKIKKKVSW